MVLYQRPHCTYLGNDVSEVTGSIQVYITISGLDYFSRHRRRHLNSNNVSHKASALRKKSLFSSSLTPWPPKGFVKISELTAIDPQTLIGQFLIVIGLSNAEALLAPAPKSFPRYDITTIPRSLDSSLREAGNVSIPAVVNNIPSVEVQDGILPLPCAIDSGFGPLVTVTSHP